MARRSFAAVGLDLSVHDLESRLFRLRHLCRSQQNTATQRQRRARRHQQETLRTYLQVAWCLTRSWCVVAAVGRVAGVFNQEAAPWFDENWPDSSLREAVAAADVRHRIFISMNASGRTGHDRAVRKAVLLVVELHVAAWLADRNALGVALSRAQLVVALRRFWPPEALFTWALKFLRRLEENPNVAAKWACRFRRAWSVTWRRLPARADLDDGELRRRVPWETNALSFRAEKGGPILAPFLCQL